MAAKRELQPSTPEQQAATAALFNGFTADRYLEALARVGYVDDACAIAGISRRTIENWRSQGKSTLDGRTFAAAEADAKDRYGDRLASKVTTAVLNCPEDQLIRTPTAAIAAVNWFKKEFRPNAGGLTVAVQVNTADLLTEKQVQHIATAFHADD